MIDEVKEVVKHKRLMEELASGGCTLILGPEFCMLEKEETLAQSICDFIAEKHLAGKPYISEDGFFYSTKDCANTYIEKKIKDFYKDLCQKETPAYYNLIAQIPFNFIISLSPDDFLHRTLNEIQLKHNFVYFKKGAAFTELEDKEQKEGNGAEKGAEIYTKKMVKDNHFDPSTKPLLFNLFGIYDDQDSLVVTHNALFEFLYSSFPPDGKFKNWMKKAITDSSSFLCLGFQYNKWYQKIIFFIIKKIFEKAEKEQAGKTAIYIPRDEDVTQKRTLDFYENQFKVFFTSQRTLDFIHDIYRDCSAKNLLRKIAVDPGNENGTKARKARILHISSNPDGEQNYLNYSSEYKKIEQAWKSGTYRHSFELLREGAVTQKELMQHIKNHDPDLLIMAVHGKDDLTLTFADDQNQEVDFSIDDYANGISMIKNVPGSHLKGIIFNSCYSMDIARELVEKRELLNYAIGMEGMINDKAIPVLMEGFFGAYFDSKDFSYSYKMANYLIGLNDEQEIKDSNSQIIFFSKKQ